MDIKKTTSGLLVLTQLLPVYFPLAYATFPASPFSVDRLADSSSRPEDALSHSTMPSGDAMPSGNPSDALKGMAINQATGAVSNEVQAWLSQFGTARVQMNVDTHGDWSNSAVDFLLPVYETPKNMLFTQLGYRAPDGRQTVNVGAGVRTFRGNWMLGSNLFFDNDLTGHNRRVGIGAEAWTDYLKFSANTYFGTTDWHASHDFADYNERPADGWDIRTEAYLPDYPQLGGHLVYEQYHGNSVALIDKNDRQRNPRAITAGVSWTPFPLLTAGVDYQTGSSGINDTRLSLMLRYQPGASLSEQLDPHAVQALRSLAGSRHELVERNNTVVLDYRKQDLIKLALPARKSGLAGDVVTINAAVNAKYGLKRVEWQSPELLAAGGKLSDSGGITANVTLPAWQEGNNHWAVRAVAWDTRGNKSNLASTLVVVNQPATIIRSSDLIVTRDNAVADGSTNNAVQAKVTDGQGNPLAGEVVTFSADHGATISKVTGTTDAKGVARATLTSYTPGTAVVTASLASGAEASVNTTFTPLGGLTLSNITVTRNDALADGIDKNSVSMQVTDSNGTPLAGQIITLAASNGATIAPTRVTTDDKGIATADLTSLQAGTSMVTATMGNGVERQVEVRFITLVSQASISVTTTKDYALRDGVDVDVVEATVVDTYGAPVPGEMVAFKTQSSSSQVLVTRAITDANGKARTSVVSTFASTDVVTASVNSGVEASAPVNFLLLHDTLSMNVNYAQANGTDKDMLSFTLTRPDNGQPVAGQEVIFSTMDPITLSTTRAITDANGTAEISITSTVTPSSPHGFSIKVSNVACCSITYDGVYFR